MKQLYLYIFFFIISGSSAQCARSYAKTDTLPRVERFDNYYADSIKYVVPRDRNAPANVSLITSILAPITTYISVLNFSSAFGAIIVTGILGLIAFSTGIGGLKKRKKIIQAKYSSRPDSDILPLGYAKSYIGLIVGLALFLASSIIAIGMVLSY